MTTEIKVDNLKCHGCANTITNSLQKIDGVEMVGVDTDTSRVYIKHGSGLLRGVFTDKLSSLGYPEQGTTTIFQKAKSYVSCAVGRMS